MNKALTHLQASSQLVQAKTIDSHEQSSESYKSIISWHTHLQASSNFSQADATDSHDAAAMKVFQDAETRLQTHQLH